MSSEHPDDIPYLRPVSPSDAELRADFDDPAPQPGFGFWMAVVWSLFFFVVSQLVIGIACGLPLVLAAVFIDKNPPPQNPEQMLKSDPVLVALLLGTMCAHVGGLAFVWLLLRWQVGRQWKRKIALTRLPSGTHAVLTLVGLVAMLGVGSWVAALVNHVVPSAGDLFRWAGAPNPMQGTTDAIAEMVKVSPLALAIFTVGVCPAFDEEFLCRGFLGYGLSQRYKGWAVVLMVSFLFGCLHVDPQQGIGAMFLGLAMHFAYLATRSLWVPMALHFLNNTLNVLVFWFQNPQGGSPFAVLESFDEIMEHGPVVSKALFVASSLFLFAAVAYAFYQTRCRLESVNPELPTWEPSGVSSVELPPKGSGTVVTHDPISALSVALVFVASLAFAGVLALA